MAPFVFIMINVVVIVIFSPLWLFSRRPFFHIVVDLVVVVKSTLSVVSLFNDEYGLILFTFSIYAEEYRSLAIAIDLESIRFLISGQ